MYKGFEPYWWSYYLMVVGQAHFVLKKRDIGDVWQCEIVTDTIQVLSVEETKKRNFRMHWTS
jgi:hypothetical protein